MDGVGGDGPSTAAAALNQWRHELSKTFQYYLDKSTPHSLYRWIGTFVLVCVYALRVYYLQGFYIVSYGLGIYILNLLIGFFSPLVDLEMELSDGPMLPTKGSDEFKPFIHRVPEFKFWYAITKAFCVAFVMTFFSMFDGSAKFRLIYDMKFPEKLVRKAIEQSGMSESKSKSSSTTSIPDQCMSDLTAKIRSQCQQEMDEKLDQKVREIMKKLPGQNPDLSLS